MSEPTELAGAAEAETQAAYGWALDYEPTEMAGVAVDDLPTQPTQRLTSRHITALALAASLIVIAVAGAVMLVVPSPKPSEPSEPVAITPAAVLDGTYRFDFNPMSDTIMGSPNPPSDTHPNSNPTTVWRAFRSACTPSGCTATETVLDDTNHQVAKAPLSTHQWRFTNGRWEELPEKSRETRDTCGEGNTVTGDETVLYTVSLEPQPDGSLRGLSTATAISSECGQEGSVQQFPFVATRVGDVPLGVPVADPSTVSVPNTPAAPVAGPVLDGTYRFDEDDLHTTYSDGSRNSSTHNTSRWFAFRSMCTAAGCAATEAHLDEANHQEPTGLANVFHFINGHWVDNGVTAPISCGPNPADAATDKQTVTLTTDLVPQPDGTLRGVHVITYKSNECGNRGLIMTTPVVGTRTGPVPPNVVLADPALFV